MASTLAAAIIQQQREVVSAEAAVALYEKIAAQIYGLSPYVAIKSSSGQTPVEESKRA